jgi:hypothetical protein
LDSISLVPVLSGREHEQRKHEYLYWEFYEGGVSQAVLLEGRWKGIRLKRASAPMQLFDLSQDIGEQNDVARQHPELVGRIAGIMTSARQDNEFWKLPAAD